MTPEALLAHVESRMREALDTMKKKNADYSGAVADALGNFRVVEALGVATTEQGFMTRMLDKYMRVASFMKNGTLAVKDESAGDTLLDLANYCLLMHAHLTDRKKVDDKEQVLQTLSNALPGYLAGGLSASPVLGNT